MKFDRSMFTKKFVTEAREHVAFLEKSIIGLEENPDNLSSLDEIKRAAHTLKGSARMLKFKAISRAAHYAEDLFIALKDGKSKVTQPLIDGLLELSGFIKHGVEAVAVSEDEPELPENFESIVEAVLNGTYSVDVLVPDPPDSTLADSTELPEEDAENESLPVNKNLSATDSTPAGESLSASEGFGNPNRRKSDRKNIHTEIETVEETVRVGVNELEGILNSIGEISLNQRVVVSTEGELSALCNKIVHSLSADEVSRNSPIFWQLKDLQRLIHEIEEKQHTLSSNIRQTYYDAGKLRMIPLQSLFERFYLQVRETARSRGKRVKLTIEGGSVTIDKQIVDLLYAPLLHLINNSIDHGIEDGLTREKQKKDPTGRITISASPMAGSMEIIITDDGRGIHCDRIVARALEKGIVTEETVHSMSRADKLQLVFKPGLSSAEIITELSGRGVGMDVVRMTIEEQLKGTIMLASEDGIGTTTVIRLPLSLSSNRLFIVRSGKKLYGIPLSSVVTSRLFDINETIPLGNGRAIKFENQFIPLIPAGKFVDGGRKNTNAEDGAMVIIVASGAEKIGLIIDEIIDEQEMMIKPLPALYDRLLHVGGITFGRDGALIPLLHIPDLIEKSHLFYESHQKISSVDSVPHIQHKILVVDDSHNTREVQKHILEVHGYTVVLAGDGLEAFDKLEEEPDVSLVVTDIEMPVLDGFGLVRKIRNHSTFCELPVVILSSRETVEDRSKGVEVGANAYIVKREFDEEKLTATLRTLLP